MVRAALVSILLLPGVALAGISSPDSHVIASRDATTVLVMISPDVGRDQTRDVTLPDGRRVNLRETFKRSGAYDVTTLKPVWQVDWFSFAWDLRWSDDLRHVVRANPNGLHADWAVAFYDRGTLVRTYRCDQLLSGLRSDRYLPFTTSGWHFEWYENAAVTADGTALALSTTRRRINVAGHWVDLGLQESYLFDLGDGSILSRRVVGVWRVWAYALGIVLLLATLLAGTRLTFRRLRALLRSRGFTPALKSPT